MEFQASIKALKLRIAAKERKCAAAESAAAATSTGITAESATGNGLQLRNNDEQDCTGSAPSKPTLESTTSTVSKTSSKPSATSKAGVTKQEVRRRLAELRRQQQAVADTLRAAQADKAHARVAQTSTLMAQLQAQAFKLDRGLAPLRQRTAQADAHLKKLRVAEIAAKIQMVQAESVVVGDSSFT